MTSSIVILAAILLLESLLLDKVRQIYCIVQGCSHLLILWNIVIIIVIIGIKIVDEHSKARMIVQLAITACLPQIRVETRDILIIYFTIW